MKVELALKGFDELVDLWSQAPELVQRELTSAAWASSLRVEREVRERTPKGANGFLGMSIAALEPVVIPGGVMGIVGTSLGYAEPVELGTKPHMPPVQPLVEWAEVVLGLDGKDAEQAAWAIARKISKKGTEGAFMFRDGFAVSEDYIKRKFRQALSNIRAALAGGGTDGGAL
jgi:hypothetical protein